MGFERTAYAAATGLSDVSSDFRSETWYQEPAPHTFWLARTISGWEAASNIKAGAPEGLGGVVMFPLLQLNHLIVNNYIYLYYNL